MRTITATLNAYLSDIHGIGPKELRELDDTKLAARLNYYYADISNWVRVGKATITVDLVDADGLAQSMVEALKAQLQKERAESEFRCNAILEKISQLQAITYSEGPI